MLAVRFVLHCTPSSIQCCLFFPVATDSIDVLLQFFTEQHDCHGNTLAVSNVCACAHAPVQFLVDINVQTVKTFAFLFLLFFSHIYFKEEP